MCADFPDWTIATAGSESSVKIGYEYGRMVTGDVLQIELDEEAESQSEIDPQEDRTMVSASAEVYVCSTQLFLHVFMCFMCGFPTCIGIGGARTRHA